MKKIKEGVLMGFGVEMGMLIGTCAVVFINDKLKKVNEDLNEVKDLDSLDA